MTRPAFRNCRRGAHLPWLASMLILIDGSHALMRAFHALPLLTTSAGEHTGAIFGVINMLRKITAEHQPEYAAVVFDTPVPTFRDVLYPAYKAQRPEFPVELRGQIQPLHAVIQALGLAVVKIPGVEADDVIATLATRAAATGIPAQIVSGDKDFAQLVDKNITLRDTMKNLVLDRDGVIAKFGVAPEQMVDYLTLIGDAVDNIPGVPGVGPKTAVNWLCEYGSLDKLLERAATIKGKVGANLRANLTQIALTRQLITLQRDLDLPITLENLRVQIPDHVTLKEWFVQLEFHSWLMQLDF